MNTAALLASKAVLAISGVDPDMAPSYAGQLLCANLIGTLRGSATPTLIRLNSLLDIPHTARLCKEHAGDGTVFYRVRYEGQPSGGRRQRKSIYLGTDPEVAEWAEGILREKRWRASLDDPPALDHQRIPRLRQMRRQVHRVAQRVASLAGYGFRGSRLVEKRHAD